MIIHLLILVPKMKRNADAPGDTSIKMNLDRTGPVLLLITTVTIKKCADAQFLLLSIMLTNIKLMTP